MTADRIFQILPLTIRSDLRKVVTKALDGKANRFYAEIIDGSDLVFDIGANIGDFTQIFIDAGAHVVAVDPQPYCVEALKSRFFANEQVKIIEKGVSNEPGSLDFYISKGNIATSTFSQKWAQDGPFSESREWIKTSNVPVTTIDSLVETYGMPKYCKVDVEGHELEVLRGMTKKTRYVSIEYTRSMLLDTIECLKYLDNLGYTKFNYTPTLFFDYAIKDWVDKESLLEHIDKNIISPVGDIFATY